MDAAELHPLRVDASIDQGITQHADRFISGRCDGDTQTQQGQNNILVVIPNSWRIIRPTNVVLPVPA